MSLTLDDLRGRLQKAKSTTVLGNPALKACCPAHEDRNPSLSAWIDQAGWLHFRCHAGCSEDQVLKALNLTGQDRAPSSQTAKRHIAQKDYIYRDEGGSPVIKKTRIEKDGKKSFHQNSYRDGDWHPTLRGLGDRQHTLYNLPQLLDAVIAGKTIYINEGEKACDYMAHQGLVATCHTHGSTMSSWIQSNIDKFKGAHVVIVADRDEVGEKYARQVASRLNGIAWTVRIVQSKTKNRKDDAYDHFAKGYGVRDFIEIPPIKPPAILETQQYEGEEFQPAKTDFLVEPYLPKGKCVLLDADGGTGKTSLALAWAASLSSGKEPLTGQERAPARILYLHKGEDETKELATVFRANGGAFQNIEFYDGDLDFNPPGLQLLEETIKSGKFALCVVDAFFYFLLGTIEDTNASLPALSVMQRLNRVAADTGCTFWNIRHTRKGQLPEKASDLGMGSVQFRNSHRGQILLRYHPQKPEVVVATDEKGSLLVPRGDHFCYRRDGHQVVYLQDIPNPFDLIDEPDYARKRRLAEAFLREHLTGHLVAWDVVQQRIQQLGIGQRTLEQAKKTVGGISQRVGDQSYWTIPTNQEAQPQSDPA